MVQQQLIQQAHPQAAPATQNGPKPRGRRKKIRTEPIRPICPQCEKQFSNQSALTKHKLTHSDERKFACQQCSKAFKRHDHLTGHMQTHSNRKPYNCTIQGCDKTYCDARSLRRHKENIHHIITPRDMNGHHQNHYHHNHQHQHNHHNQNHNHNQNSNKSSSDLLYDSMSDMNNNSINSTGTLLNLDHQNSHNEINLSPATTYQTSTLSSTSLSNEHLATSDSSAGIYMTTNNDQQQQPSQLFKRRIQRLHSDQGTYGCNSDQHDILGGSREYLACSTTGSNSTNSHNVPSQQVPHTGNTLHGNQYLNMNGHHHQQASYSADYASTQRFDFNTVNMNGHHMDHAISSSTLPLSAADSVTDSGLDLNAHYEQLTPSHQQPLPPPPTTTQQQQQPQQQQGQLTQSSPSQAQQPQQLQNLQPSHLLIRRIQRLHSDQGTYGSTGGAGGDPNDPLVGRGYLACNTAPINSHNMAPQHHIPHTGDSHQQRNSNNQYLSNQHASYSADYASTLSFDFANMNGHHMDHAISSSTIPLSADSGLDLNVHYEQLTPSHQQPQQQPQQTQQTQILRQPQQQQQQQQHHQTTTQLPPPLQLQPLQTQQCYHPHQHQQHVSYSAGYSNSQQFDFDFTSPHAIDGSGGGPLTTCSSTISDRDINNNLMNEQHSSYVTYVSQDEELRS